jgi:uncharacterized membrane protein
LSRSTYIVEVGMGARDFLGGVAVGAGLVYFLDPERGPGRRERLRAQVGSAAPAIPGGYGARLGDLEGLEAASLGRRGARSGPRLARLAGGALLAYGLFRRGRSGRALRTAGLSLATAGLRSGTLPLPRASSERRRVVDIQKTLFVEAPLERVFAFWSHYDNFPLFMSNVREVNDLGGDRSRWVVHGPGGVPIEWNAVLTARDENRLLAWRSEPGSMLENAGAIRFAREGGGTRIDLRFCYNPPAGPAGRAVTDFFGADPRARMNEDLERLKTLLESTVRSDPHGEKPGP